jgi:hypothetical protein
MAFDESKNAERINSLIVDAVRPIQTRSCAGLNHLIIRTSHTNRAIFADHFWIRQISKMSNRDFVQLSGIA